MSAFIVENETINNILRWLDDDCRFPNNKNTFGHAAKQLTKIGFNLNFEENLDRLGSEMFLLNCQAVNIRYDQNHNADEFEYKFVDGAAPTQIQAVKSLQCWLYQCSEGNIPETSQLYKTMESIKFLICESIVDNLPEYEQAKWG